MVTGGGIIIDLFTLAFGLGRFTEFFVDQAKNSDVVFGVSGMFLILPEKWAGPAINILRVPPSETIHPLYAELSEKGEWSIVRGKVDWRKIIGLTYGKTKPRLEQEIILETKQNIYYREGEKIATEEPIKERLVPTLSHGDAYGKYFYAGKAIIYGEGQPVRFNAHLIDFLAKRKMKVFSNGVTTQGVFPISMDGKVIRGFIGPIVDEQLL